MSAKSSGKILLIWDSTSLSSLDFSCSLLIDGSGLRTMGVSLSDFFLIDTCSLRGVIISDDVSLSYETTGCCFVSIVLESFSVPTSL